MKISKKKASMAEIRREFETKNKKGKRKKKNDKESPFDLIYLL